MSKPLDFACNCPKCGRKTKAFPAGPNPITGEKMQKCLRCGHKFPVHIFGTR